MTSIRCANCGVVWALRGPAPNWIYCICESRDPIEVPSSITLLGDVPYELSLIFCAHAGKVVELSAETVKWALEIAGTESSGNHPGSPRIAVCYDGWQGCRT